MTGTETTYRWCNATAAHIEKITKIDGRRWFLCCGRGRYGEAMNRARSLRACEVRQLAYSPFFHHAWRDAAKENSRPTLSASQLLMRKTPLSAVAAQIPRLTTKLGAP